MSKLPATEQERSNQVNQMFEETEKPFKITTPNAVAAGFDLDKYTPAEMIVIYDEVKKRLPPTSLGAMNVEEELLLQFHTLRALQTSVLGNVEIPPNQMAQVANTTSSSLNTIALLQNKVYDSERSKAIETYLIRQLVLLPKEQAEAFLDAYEAGYSSILD